MNQSPMMADRANQSSSSFLGNSSLDTSPGGAFMSPPPLQLKVDSTSVNPPPPPQQNSSEVMQRTIVSVFDSTSGKTMWYTDKQRTCLFDNQQDAINLENNLNRFNDSIGNKKKKKFKNQFRAADSGMDEMISCQATYDTALKMKKNNAPQQDIDELLSTSHQTRFPTAFTGHNVKLDNGKNSKMQHPTSNDTATYSDEYTQKGNPKWSNHGKFDKKRIKYVKQGNNPQEMQAKAIEFSLNEAVQPPFCKNSNVSMDLSDDEAMEAFKKREDLKKLHPDYDPNQKQAYDSKWVPKDANRGVSPMRELPSQYQ